MSMKNMMLRKKHIPSLKMVDENIEDYGYMILGKLRLYIWRNMKI